MFNVVRGILLSLSMSITFIQPVKGGEYDDLITFNRWYLAQAGYPVDDPGTCGEAMAQSTWMWIAAVSEDTSLWMQIDGLLVKDGCSYEAQLILLRTIRLVHADRA